MTDIASNVPRLRILVVDDDPALCEALKRGLTARGYDVRVALTMAEAVRSIETDPPEHAVIDLKLPDGNGLKLLTMLKAASPCARIVVLTGYGSIPTVVEAIKRGANYFLAKPANLDQLIVALKHDVGAESIPTEEKPMSLARLEWEHIQRVLHEHSGNVSSAARALSMHRRTLQRKISKHPVRN